MSQMLVGDCRESMRALIAAGTKVQMCVTSPPYWGLRDYGMEGQLGLEPTIGEYVAGMVEVFELVRQLLKDDGTLWLNLGDSYANDGKWGGETGGKQHYLGEANRKRVGREKRLTGLKPKDLCGIPWRVAFALQDAGWWLRQDIIWAKKNCMPESVQDRCTKSHEYIFLMARSERYYFDALAIAEQQDENERTRRLREAEIGKNTRYEIKRTKEHGQHPPGQNGVAVSAKARQDLAINGTRNKRSVWHIGTAPYPEAHFATYPPALIEPCILAGSKPGDTVLDPFFGSGTTGEVAQRLGREWIGCELSPEYAKLAERRTSGTIGLQLA